MDASQVDTNDEDIIGSIERRRRELDISYADLARQTGLRRRTVMACMAGHTEISLRVFLRIASVLRLTLHLVHDDHRQMFAQQWEQGPLRPTAPIAVSTAAGE